MTLPFCKACILLANANESQGQGWALLSCNEGTEALPVSFFTYLKGLAAVSLTSVRSCPVSSLSRSRFSFGARLLVAPQQITFGSICASNSLFVAMFARQFCKTALKAHHLLCSALPNWGLHGMARETHRELCEQDSDCGSTVAAPGFASSRSKRKPSLSLAKKILWRRRAPAEGKACRGRAWLWR